MGTLPYDLSITVIAIIAVVFILLGIFPSISNQLGLESGTPGHRLLSIVIGLMLFALLLIYWFARESTVVS